MSRRSRVIISATVAVFVLVGALIGVLASNESRGSSTKPVAPAAEAVPATAGAPTNAGNAPARKDGGTAVHSTGASSATGTEAPATQDHSNPTKPGTPTSGTGGGPPPPPPPPPPPHDNDRTHQITVKPPTNTDRTHQIMVKPPVTPDQPVVVGPPPQGDGGSTPKPPPCIPVPNPLFPFLPFTCL